MYVHPQNTVNVYSIQLLILKYVMIFILHIILISSVVSFKSFTSIQGLILTKRCSMK